ncbi:MAG: RNA polymerase III subunit C82 [Phylliscum demangeonii]|nr:MAG: RNA polymerase III subunit C82 [Phylliscum demangeonii]
MSHDAAELSTLLVDEVYGELSSRVFEALLLRGRLHLRDLAHHSQLPTRLLKHGLAVLIQQDLVRYYTDRKDDVTFYEADWKAAYALIRSGKAIRLAEKRFGDAAGELVSNLLQLGHSKISDLTKAYLAAADTEQAHAAGHDRGHEETAVNGIGDGDGGGRKAERAEKAAVARDELARSVRDVIDCGLVAPIWEARLRAPADNREEAVAAAKAAGWKDSTKGSKSNLDFEQAVKQQLKKWRDEKPHAAPGVKRAREENGEGGGHKRVRTDVDYERTSRETAHPSSTGPAPPDADEAVVVRVNFDKYTVLSRNQRLAELAAEKIGRVPSRVYAALLEQVSRRIPRCHDDLEIADDEEYELEDLPSVSTQEVAAAVPAHLDLTAALGPVAVEIAIEASAATNGPAAVNGAPRSTTKRPSSGDDDDGSDAEHAAERDQRPPKRKRSAAPPDEDGGRPAAPRSATRATEVGQHLRLLADEPHRFVQRLARTHGPDAWTVDFRRLMQELQQSELESVIRARFGPLALRVVRVLQAHGKLDEKQISNRALHRLKDIRLTLAALHAAGYLELQEIPRDGLRRAMSSIFLWFFDRARARRLLLQDLYKTMARLLQRAQADRALLRPLLAKAERTDVVGREDSLLSSHERAALHAWRLQEERLLGQIMRLDRMVELYRDF